MYQRRNTGNLTVKSMEITDTRCLVAFVRCCTSGDATLPHRAKRTTPHHVTDRCLRLRVTLKVVLLYGRLPSLLIAGPAMWTT